MCVRPMGLELTIKAFNTSADAFLALWCPGESWCLAIHLDDFEGNVCW